jgi:steroid 5-alpha reductase family enzyme
MVLYLWVIAAIALAVSVLMAGAWVVQQRTGNSGWVDTIWTFPVGRVGDYQSRTSMFFPLPPQEGVVT